MGVHYTCDRCAKTLHHGEICSAKFKHSSGAVGDCFLLCVECFDAVKKECKKSIREYAERIRACQK